MKYELMALVNSIARQEQGVGNEMLAERFQNLYDNMAASKFESDVTPVNVGEDIFEIYKHYLNLNYNLRKVEEPKVSTEYNKPFFLDPADFEKELKYGEMDNQHEAFVLELFDLLGLKEPRGFQDNMRNRMALIKQKIRALKQDSINLGWLENPDRMGK